MTRPGDQNRNPSRRFAVVLGLAVIVWSAIVGAIDVCAAQSASSRAQSERAQDISLVQWTLAQNVQQVEAMERVEEKLSHLSDEDLWVATTLARRISESPFSAAADIAQLLLAALIVTQ